MNYNTPLEPGFKYHIYNRAVGNDLLFYQERNYNYFLEQYFGRLSPHLETLAYCLLPNHFHLLVEIKGETIEKEINSAFRGFFIGYSQAINSQENRRGSLFMRPYKRKKVKDDSYFTTLFAYIHLNPWLHNTQRDFRKYKWSSYRLIISGEDLRINRQEVLDWFGGVEAFKEFHESSHNFKAIEDIRLEG